VSSFAAMGSAIYARLGTVSYTYPSSGTTTTTGTLGTYDTLAPQQGAAAPYIIFQLQDSLDLYTFGTVAGESTDYLVKAISNRQTPNQAITIYDQAHEALQDAPLSIAGGYPLRVRRTNRVMYRDNDGFWHIGGVYRVDSWDSN
jgi:hypothetical protein